MTELGVKLAGDSYSSLISEAFIAPIRAVVVVDDEYPTLDELIGKELGESDKSWDSVNVARAKDIIDFCRDNSRRWMLEIHNGQLLGTSTGEQAAQYLNQTDLMVLDYHLNPADPTSGEQSIKILRQLARNDHFNLVIVHTKGYEDAGGDIERVVREVAMGLTFCDERLVPHQKAVENAQNLIQKWEESEVDIFDRLRGQLDIDAYLRVRSSEDCGIDYCRSQREFAGFFALLDKAPVGVAGKERHLLRWALADLQERMQGLLSPDDLGCVSYKWGEDGINWVRTDRLFVTVVSKQQKPDELPNKLLEALAWWSPAPHRLLMSKMRAELDERGVLAEGHVLSDRYLQAGWLQEFLTEHAAERTWKIRGSVNHHWESLGDVIQSNVLDYGNRLGEQLARMERAEVIRQHLAFEPDVPPHDEKIAASLNKYACSKAVEGAHLSIGHVLKIDQDGNPNYWLCLSPACDLVPGQKNSGWPKRLDSFVPFRAVELFGDNQQAALESAVSGAHLFLELEGLITAFRFTPPIAGKSNGEAGEANPKWEEMFVANRGRFIGDGNELHLVRISSDGDELVTRKTTAKVVSQLRYEYALNLLQRLGANLSRVGLGFVPFTGNASGDGG